MNFVLHSHDTIDRPQVRKQRWHKFRVKYYCAIAATETNNLAIGLN